MASVIDTAKPERRWFGRAPAGRIGKADDRADGHRRWLPGSRLGRLIIGLNLVGLVILIGGALLLNEFRQGLVQARTESLRTQGELIAKVIAIGATSPESAEPRMDDDRAAVLIQDLFVPTTQRARLFDKNGRQIFDSYLVADRVEERVLPPARRRGDLRFELPHSPA